MGFFWIVFEADRIENVTLFATLFAAIWLSAVGLNGRMCCDDTWPQEATVRRARTAVAATARVWSVLPTIVVQRVLVAIKNPEAVFVQITQRALIRVGIAGNHGLERELVHDAVALCCIDCRKAKEAWCPVEPWP